MRLPIGLALAVVICLTSASLAQDPGSLDQLKRMYDEALEQLKSAQDHKKQLESDNDALHAKVRQLEGQLSTANTQLDQHRRDSADIAEKTFFLRSHYSAWRMFLERYPDLLSRWKLFLGDGMSSVPPRGQNPDDAWPLDDQTSALR